MKIVADENIDNQTVERLRQDGHTVWYIIEMESGITDDIVLAIANQENAILLTADKDFGELVFRLGQVSSGVILIRLPGLSNSNKAEIISQAINQYANELLGAFTVVSPSAIRIRRI